MKFINRKTHAVMDYLVGIILIAAPWLLGFADNGPAKWSAIGVGLVLLAMSLITDYEGGLIKAVPMSFHLGMDVLAGLFLATSPWLLGYHMQVFLPHVIVGILEIGAGLFSQSASQHRASGDINTISHSFR
jgi:hypothetical protein